MFSPALVQLIAGDQITVCPHQATSPEWHACGWTHRNQTCHGRHLEVKQKECLWILQLVDKLWQEPAPLGMVKTLTWIGYWSIITYLMVFCHVKWLAGFWPATVWDKIKECGVQKGRGYRIHYQSHLHLSGPEVARIISHRFRCTAMLESNFFNEKHWA